MCREPRGWETCRNSIAVLRASREEADSTDSKGNGIRKTRVKDFHIDVQMDLRTNGNKRIKDNLTAANPGG